MLMAVRARALVVRPILPAPMRDARHVDGTWAARSAAAAIKMSRGRTRRRKKVDGPPRAPRVMQRVDNGVPEIAQTHPEQYEELLERKLGTLKSLLAAAAGD